MRKIYKYILNPSDSGTASIVHAPDGGKVIAAQSQHEQICVWMSVDPQAQERNYIFHVVPTGGTEPSGAKYVDTVQLMGGRLIFHVYLEG